MEDKIKEIQERLVEKTEDKPQNPAINILLISLLIALLGALLITSPADDGFVPQSVGENTEATGRPVPTVTYDVRSNGVFPYEHIVKPGQNVAVYNDMGSKIFVQREDTGNIREVSPDNYIVYTMDRISYFEINSSNRKLGSLKVNVQTP